MSAVGEDLLAALAVEVQAAGPSEVDKLSPASTRGIGDGSDPNGRSQKSNRLVVERVDTCPWPEVPPFASPAEQRAAWDGWRAEVARRQIEKDAACGAAPTVPLPDSDEVEDFMQAERKRVHVLFRVIDGEGVEWKDCPEWELDDLPQPVTVLEQIDRPVYPKRPKPAPVEALAAVVDVSESRASTRSLMTEGQVEFALGLLEQGQTVLQVSDQYWREWGFASRKSCEFSLRRRRGALANKAKYEEVAA